MNFYKKGNILHHAYCIVGSKDEIMKELEIFFTKELDFVIAGNSDFWYGEYDSMSIEDSRALKDLHQNKPTTGERKIFVISANFINERAQNAMLKLFEEPSGDTHFFLILPSQNNLLSTLKSRMIIIPHYGKNNSIINVKDFLKMSVGGRIEEIKNLIKSITDEEESKIEVTKFLNGLELELKKKIDLSKTNSEAVKIFEEIEKVRGYASIQSPSLKMLLEHLALFIPVLKD